MDSESASVDWVANFRDQFYTLCAEAEAIIVQEPIEYVRNQFLTAGESIKQFCSELVEDAKTGFLEEFCYFSGSPKQEEDADRPRRKMPSTSIADNYETRTPLTFSSPLLPTEPDFSHTEKGNIGSVEEYKLPCDEVTSSSNTCSAGATHSFDKDSVRSECELRNELLEVDHVVVSDPECKINEEARERYVADLSKEDDPPSGDQQRLDESLIVVDSREFRSDSVIKPYLRTYQKIIKRFRKKPSCESGCRIVDSEKDGKEWKRFDEEDASDSDWEIV